MTVRQALAVGFLAGWLVGALLTLVCIRLRFVALWSGDPGHKAAYWKGWSDAIERSSELLKSLHI